MNEEVEVILQDLDETDINSLIKKTLEMQVIRKKLEELEDSLKSKIKVYLKERNWERYVDQSTKVSVTISSQQKQTVDMQQLKMMLNEQQLAQVIHVTTFEKMLIVTPETRERLKNYVRPKKKVERS